MAWVTQTFTLDHLEVALKGDRVQFRLWDELKLDLYPQTSDSAHKWAMILRKAARRLEEIGKGLG